MTDIDLRENFLRQYKFISMFICYPIKTVIRFQQKHGTIFQDSLNIVYKEGGLKRFYSGNLDSFIGILLLIILIVLKTKIQNIFQLQFFFRNTNYFSIIFTNYIIKHQISIDYKKNTFFFNQQYISKSAEFVVLLKALNSWSDITNNNVNPINLILSFMMGIMIQFTFLPFNSLYYFQQVYGYRDGKELLLYKVKSNGTSSIYHGFWSFLAGSWFGSIIAFPALYIQIKLLKLQNYQKYNNQKEDKKNEYSLFYLYSAFLTAEVHLNCYRYLVDQNQLKATIISNPFKILAIQKLTSIECKSYGQIYNQLLKEQGYQWIFRSIDTKLYYSLLKSLFIVYGYDYKKLSREI